MNLQSDYGQATPSQLQDGDTYLLKRKYQCSTCAAICTVKTCCLVFLLYVHYATVPIHYAGDDLSFLCHDTKKDQMMKR